MAFSPLLFGLVAISLQQAVSACFPNQVYNQQGVQWRCCQVGVNWIPVAQACVDYNGFPVQENETKIVMNSYGMGFTNQCTKNGNVFQYHAINCLVNVGGTNQVVAFGDTVNYGEFQYKCIQHPDLRAEIQPIGCKTQNGTYIAVGGQIYRHCSNSGALCSDFQCSIQGFQIFYTCKNCFINNSVIPIGHQCPWQQHTCTCTAAGPVCP